MTRIEKFFHDLDEAYDEKGEYLFDPVPHLQAYLKERDEYMLRQAKVSDNIGISESLRTMVNDQNEFCAAFANKFDNFEVLEDQS